jgi:hypothetical protein
MAIMIEHMQLCPDCGSNLTGNCTAQPNVIICNECRRVINRASGELLPVYINRRSRKPIDPVQLIFPLGRKKSPVVAFFLNWLWPGVGYMYLGQIPAGIMWAIIGPVSLVLLFGLLAFASGESSPLILLILGLTVVFCVSLYGGVLMECRKYNRGEAIHRWEVKMSRDDQGTSPKTPH